MTPGQSSDGGWFIERSLKRITAQSLVLVDDGFVQRQILLQRHLSCLKLFGGFVKFLDHFNPQLKRKSQKVCSQVARSMNHRVDRLAFIVPLQNSPPYDSIDKRFS
jgi:hypothetical protein